MALELFVVSARTNKRYHHQCATFANEKILKSQWPSIFTISSCPDPRRSRRRGTSRGVGREGDFKSPRCADANVISIPHCVAVHLLPCKRTGSRQREMRLRVKRRGVGRESNSKCLGRELQRSRIGDRRSRRRVVKARLHLGDAIGAGPRTLPRPPPRSTETPPSLGVSVWQSLTVLTGMVRSAIGCLRRSKLLMTPYTISLHIHTWTSPSGSH